LPILSWFESTRSWSIQDRTSGVVGMRQTLLV
jgi:hypothetical protein